ncbi:MAG: pirin family protein [Nannocystaceae bacterium]
MTTETRRHVLTRVTAHRQREGGGFVVRRPFPGRVLPDADPFLLLDEMGPVTYRPGQAIGAPDHPHRGFETVTYLLAGEAMHEDSAGHRGVLRPGDVQWMTAGRGLVHAEMPTPEFRDAGGRMHGFQLWVNLPARDKGIAPRYQEIAGASLPTAVSEDGLAWVRVIAGEALGVAAAIETRTPIAYHHWRLRPGAAVDVPLPAAMRAHVYVFAGAAEVAGEPVRDGQLVTLGGDGALRLALAADAAEDAELLLLAGEPIGEPIAWAGPFVMNSEAELDQAFRDYHSGEMGRIVR